MSDIPSELFLHILLQVPAESLLRFRAVCRAWRCIIDDPSFIKSHTTNQVSSNTLLIRNLSGARLFSLSLDSINYAEGCQTIEVTPVKRVIRRGVPYFCDLPVASCNGLILISHYDVKKTWVIWNPLTREFRELPEPDTEVRLRGSGIGYDYAADDYKVVRIDEQIRHGEFVNQTFVYSLKSDSWRMIKDCPYYIWPLGQGVYLNGALHWRSSNMIIVLDLETEDYTQLPLPPVPIRPRAPLEQCLDAMDGCLFLSCYYMIERLDGWMMKDYGVEKSWMKLFSFGKLDIINSLGHLRPIAYLKSKGQVLLQHDTRFFWLDIEKNSAKKVTIDGLPDNFSSQNFQGSLVRLNDSGGVGRSVAMKITGAKRKRANTRLKLRVKITDWSDSDSIYDSDSSWWSYDSDW
ncbi:hypothetical protein CDL12_29471 [Handroanthus impetiginosus]|uniref:F-box domain-containing protein n=1 Tax=Handroanthus impetiginosus TaxID=429701 RepID=A0A2G9FYC0_9LAMI|nr:hypothetical protein CDL12_29471 [Handroanthus impetiginosus]